MLRLLEGRVVEAIALLKQSLAIEVRKESMMSLAVAYGRAGDRDREMEVYQELTRLFPGTTWAQNAEATLRQHRTSASGEEARRR